MTDIEYRAWAPDVTELRAEGDGMSFTGRAVVYDSPSVPLPFVERIAPGAATRTLRARNDVKALINHNTDMVIGSTRAGTLRLTEDDRGVIADISLPDTSYGRDLSVSVARSDISAMSFGFTVVKDEWSSDYSERTIHEFRLHEVSVVAMPAYPATTALVRAIPRLAHRTGLQVDALSDAIGALESGSDLSEDQFNVLAEAIDRSRVKSDEEPVADTAPVDVLLKKLDLLEKGI